MIIAYDADTKRLAHRLHMPEDKVTALLDSSDDFVVTQRRKNPECFPRIHEESLSNILKKESFLTDWKRESEQSLLEIKLQLNSMEEQIKQLQTEVAELKANEETLVALVDSAINTANALVTSIIDAQIIIDGQKAEIAKLTPQPAN